VARVPQPPSHPTRRIPPPCPRPSPLAAGGVLHREDLEAVAALCREHGCYVLSDEVYCKLLHDDDVRLPHPPGVGWSPSP